MIIESIILQYDFNLQYSKALVQDLSETQMTLVPSSGLENHPAWTLGHLVSGSALLAEDLGAPFEMPYNWAELFLRKGPGDPRKPDPDISRYPSKKQLLTALEHQHTKVKNLLVKISDNDLNREIKWRFSQYMPTLGDLVMFLCISHETMHLGQIAAWRRAQGLPSALASL